MVFDIGSDEKTLFRDWLGAMLLFYFVVFVLLDEREECRGVMYDWCFHFEHFLYRMKSFM